MGIDAKHAYRFGFLKSEKWQNFRLEALVAHGGVCYVCGKNDISNDVHHIHYPDLWEDTKVSHVIILCRRHHKSVHLLMDRFPHLEKARVAKMAMVEIRTWNGILWGLKKLSRSSSDLERWSDYRTMVNLDWKMKKAMMRVGRHETPVDNTTTVS